MAGAVSASPVIVGGNGAAGTATLAITGGALYVNVGSSLPATGTNVSFGVTNNLLTLSWPANYIGWQLWSNSVNLANTNYWFQVTGATSTNRVNIPINPAQPNVFYRLQHP